ncbi:beta-galactosidase [Paenibacillus sp. F411]|uniref:beta-galactosidase n=1 Tax=Paenibacillus sp. F411 TaxID=2820239 RepID=UPI001AAF888C|nr:beta-galactosidase [Paenibacillus sp. F411]MBO2942653.1 beta-galactosidase [Paenibacillus sp. F411]
MFVFGSQYLRSWTPRMKDWDRDLASMKEHGFNTIRAWLVWNALELEEGQYNWDYLDTFSDLVAKHGLKVGYLFHLHGAPEWLIRKYPQYYYVDARGQAFEPAARSNTPSGGWPGLCYDHTEVRQYEEKFITAVVSHLSNRSEISFWEPMNEPHNWVDIGSATHDHYCFCDATRKKFRVWLQHKYGELHKLNEAWGRHHSDWEDVRPPTWRFGYNDQVDFRMFMIENVADEIRWRSDVIRKQDDRPVIAHSWGGGSITCPQLGGMAFDDWRNAQHFELWGFSAFPSSVQSSSMLGFSTDAARSAANGKTFWQAELGVGDHSGGFGRKGMARQEELAIWTWESIRHGAKGVLYWQYRKEAHGHEFGGFGLTDYAGNETENLKAVANIGRILNSYEHHFHDSTPADAEIAIVFSLQSYLVDWCDHRNSNFSIDCMSGYYRMLWEQNIPVDIVHEEFTNVEQLKRYKLVILPQPSALHVHVKEVLMEYVHSGGSILSDPYFAAFDDSLMIDYTVPGSGFESIFGCEEEDLRNQQQVEVIYRGQKLTLTNCKLKETYRNVTAEAVAEYADGSGPALIKNKAGSGYAYMSGVHLGLTYAPKDSIGDELRRQDTAQSESGAKVIVLDLVKELGIHMPLDSGCVNIQGSLLMNKDKEDILILINHSERLQDSMVQINAGPYHTAYDIVNGLERSLEGNRIHVSIPPLHVQVYLLQ